ncbi:protein NRT1/ PTR FAMILY 5.10-like [Prosopis cineraria]|uniref:protein NRT1/ PTR FAMILY 5.10-like n=1 Tax=Prosopis cineraria TaxID=364024 RepID=UPI00241058FF|nr:protein NRT1/ PTR FAMILY 5.10-like [Prosopis cineraria]
MKIINIAVSRAQAVFRYPFLLSPSAFFSWALVVGYNVVEYACVSILITFYTQEAMQDRLAEAALLLCLQEGLASFAAIILVHFTRERFGHRFFAIVISTGSYIAGIMVLWSYARQEHQEKNMPLFLVISLLFALGKGGAHPLLKSFLEHNLCECNNIRSLKAQSNEAEIKRAEICKNIWVQSSWIVGATVAIFGFMELPWVRVFHISAIVMTSSGLLFLFGSNSTGHIGQSSVHKDATKVPKRVISVKWLLMFSCIAFSLVLATGNVFFQEQGTKMKLPGIKKEEDVRFSFMIVIKSAVNEITILIFWICGANKKQGITLVRIGTGMLCAIICCVIAWKVEIERKKVVNIDKDPRTSVAWLCPHYVLLGIVEGLAQSGLEELLADEDEIETLMNPGRLSKDMVSCFGKILGIPCILIVRWWFENFNKDEAHLDRYYVMLAIFTFVFFCIYLCVAFVYMKLVPEDKEQEGGGIVEVGSESTRV